MIISLPFANDWACNLVMANETDRNEAGKEIYGGTRRKLLPCPFLLVWSSSSPAGTMRQTDTIENERPTAKGSEARS